jgi:hypothetical protein
VVGTNSPCSFYLIVFQQNKKSKKNVKQCVRYKKINNLARSESPFEDALQWIKCAYECIFFGQMRAFSTGIKN